MSTTVTGTATFGMDAFASLAVVPSANDTRGTITFTSAAPNSDRPSFTAKLQAKTFGPFLVPMSVSIVVEDGSCTYQLTGNTGGYSYDTSGNVTGLVGPDARYDLRPKLQIPGGVFCNWQSGTGSLAMVSTDANDNVALDTAVTLDGLPAAKCTFSDAASGTYIAEFSFTNAISLAGFRTIQVPVKITATLTAANVGIGVAPFQVWLYLSGGGTARLLCDFGNIPPESWHVFSFSRESSTGLVTFSGGATWDTFDSETVTKVRIVQATLAASNGYPVWVGSLRCDARARGCVTICMDGQYSSQYTIAKPILDAYKLKTSLAIVNSDIAGVGRMTLAQIDEMYQQGHECIHHTYDGTKVNGYVNATDWPAAADIALDIKAGFNYFIEHGWTRGLGKIVNAFANPFSPGTAVARQQLIQAAMSAAGVECSRASIGLYTTQMSLGYKGVVPFNIRGAIQVTSTDTTAGIKTIIDQAEENGEWAVLTFHRIVASGAGSLETTTTIFEEVCAYLDSRCSAGHLDVLPFGEAYDKHFR